MNKDLPQRSTRGKRLKQAIDDEEDQADEQFWNQEFFKEEAVDDDYKTESEPEDLIDSDFDQEEDADDDEDVEVKDDEPRKKALKPPGYKAKPKPKPKPKAKPKQEEEEDYAEEEEEEDDDEEEGEEGETRPRKPAKEPRERMAYVAPTLRRSTVAKVADAEELRQYKAATKTPRRRGGSSASNWRPLTQGELLAEAALNEIENTRSLKALLAREEETKRKAQVVKKKNTGPSVKFRSRKGPEGQERTTLELMNTFVPPVWMAPGPPPPPPGKPVCAITALPAHYRDPHTHTPFANTLAFKRLRTGAGPLAPTLQQQLVLHHHMEQVQRQQQQQARTQGQGTARPLLGEPLLEQVVAQKQRREQLEERARAVAAAARAEPGPSNVPMQGVTLDVMALVVDVQRSLLAAA